MSTGKTAETHLLERVRNSADRTGKESRKEVFFVFFDHILGVRIGIPVMVSMI